METSESIEKDAHVLQVLVLDGGFVRTIFLRNTCSCLNCLLFVMSMAVGNDTGGHVSLEHIYTPVVSETYR
ncbi:uncharacterized protein LAESUDRAFT_728554 [Laetiporus sulphureus 93-53]|uniref:Uncharacterized protein n=1 Tax=Laetiporus sulphureus 93-53 TaxID=1314785 RepID=A0A165D3G6_9APHY|nr:uncharacterized protein LAESUDRAFT_728554 [Laetiporus sulphureus 93-53]KZT04085.1 hypothetical protein LAESUDRAFT_728554 [Laetiporus sulphureus 93-53]